MGTFIMLPGSVVTSGSWILEGGGSSFVSVCSGNGGDCTQTSVDQAVCMGTAFAHAPAPGAYTLTCSPAVSMQLDGAGPFLDVNSLPAGFTVTGANINATTNRHNGVSDGGNNCCTQFQYTYGLSSVFSNASIADTVGFQNNTYNISPVPSVLAIYGNQWEFLFTCAANNTASTACGSLSYSSAIEKFSQFYISGTYIIVTSWWFNPVTNHIQANQVDPGPPWISIPAPTVIVSRIIPSQGPSTGSTTVSVEGSGFSDGASVTIGGTTATAINVANQNQIHCSTPIFSGSLTGPVTITIGGEDPAHAGIQVKANKSTGQDIVVTDF